MSSDFFIYHSCWAKEAVTFHGKKISLMTRNEFFSEYSLLATEVINAEKTSTLSHDQQKLLKEGNWKQFSMARGYTQTEIEHYQRLLYLMGRERVPQFLINGENYTFDNVPTKYFGNTNNGKGARRPCPEWLWNQWQVNKGAPEAEYILHGIAKSS
jgi:hypothetical protein